jgi:predicted N-acetyltransferase YhbS
MMPQEIRIRSEVEADHPAIYDLTRRAFAPMRFAAGQFRQAYRLVKIPSTGRNGRG